MKLLIDSCVSKVAATELEVMGHDVEHVADWPSDPGDEEVLSIAVANRRVLITLDKDFGELAVLHSKLHAGIIRLVGFRSSRQGSVCRAILDGHENALTAGALITAEPGRLRIREQSSGSAS